MRWTARILNPLLREALCPGCRGASLRLRLRVLCGPLGLRVADAPVTLGIATRVVNGESRSLNVTGREADHREGVSDVWVWRSAANASIVHLLVSSRERSGDQNWSLWEIRLLSPIRKRRGGA